MFRSKGPRDWSRGAIVLLVAVSTLTLLSAPASAARLMLPQMMREALARNHDLVAAGAQVDAVLGLLTQAWLRPKPRLNLSNVYRTHAGPELAQHGTGRDAYQSGQLSVSDGHALQPASPRTPARPASAGCARRTLHFDRPEYGRDSRSLQPHRALAGGARGRKGSLTTIATEGDAT